MRNLRIPLGAGLMVLAVAAAPLRAGPREVKVVEKATGVVRSFAALPLRGIPLSLLYDAAGVAVLPHVVKAGLVVDAEFGRGVVLVHGPDGRWSQPVFVTLTGSGIGGQAGVEATDLVLVFKTRTSLDRALRGKLTLGADVTIAAGPIGREVERATDQRLLKAEIFSYSRSRGLFVGVSLAGARLHVDDHANKAFYGVRKGRPDEVFARRGAPLASAEALRAELARLSPAPVAPPAATRVVPRNPRRR